MRLSRLLLALFGLGGLAGSAPTPLDNAELDAVNAAIANNMPGEVVLNSRDNATDHRDLVQPLYLCDHPNLQGRCTYYEAPACANNPFLDVPIQSVVIRANYRCAFYHEPNCEAYKSPPHYEEARFGDKPLYTLSYSIVSIKCDVNPILAGKDQEPSAAVPLLRRGLAVPPEQPRLRLGSIAPNFQAQTTHGDIDFHTFLDNKWTVLFSHPADFTPVCTTELGAFAKLKGEFDARGVQMIGLSADDLSSHDQWVSDINEVSNTTVQFPIIADPDRKVAFLYDMISQDDLDALAETGGIAFTIRAVFIIDPAKKIRLTMLYPAGTGRSTSEVLRVIDSLQTGDKKGVATPVNWNVGEDVIVPPFLSTEDARKKFGEVREVKKYLRFTNVGE